MGNTIIGKWSIREFQTNGGRIGYHFFPKGERSHWAIKATLWPATDGKCFIVTFNGKPMDARPSYRDAVALVLATLT